MRRLVIGLFLLLMAPGAFAQFQTVVEFVFSPPSPEPTDNVAVFIRATDSATGYVLCPETAQIITQVQVTGNVVVLDLLSVAPTGGFQRPFCDGNTVQLGMLAAGAYTVIARFVLPNGNIGPTLLTSQLQVKAAGAEAVPLWNIYWLIACAIGVAAVGMRFAGQGHASRVRDPDRLSS